MKLNTPLYHANNTHTKIYKLRQQGSVQGHSTMVERKLKLRGSCTKFINVKTRPCSNRAFQNETNGNNSNKKMLASSLKVVLNEAGSIYRAITHKMRKFKKIYAVLKENCAIQKCIMK